MGVGGLSASFGRSFFFCISSSTFRSNKKPIGLQYRSLLCACANKEDLMVLYWFGWCVNWPRGSISAHCLIDGCLELVPQDMRTLGGSILLIGWLLSEWQQSNTLRLAKKKRFNGVARLHRFLSSSILLWFPGWRGARPISNQTSVKRIKVHLALFIYLVSLNKYR